MKTYKSVLAILATVLVAVACKPSSGQLEKALEGFFEKNPAFLEKKIQEVMKKRGPQAEAPLEERIKNAITVDLNNAPFEGPADAPVTIVEFSDFQCPFCSRVVPTVHQLVKEYEGKVRFAFRQHPLPMHKDATSAAKASLAANEQGKFWEMHDGLFQNQRALNDEGILKIAQDLKLNIAKFKSDWKSTKYDAQIKADMEFAQKNGATGTPAFFINGVALKGARPIESFREVINKLLEAKGIKPPASIPAAAPAAPTPPTPAKS
jgi:protein-disulfide isomerase